MKNTHKILISIVSLMVLFSILNIGSVAAQGTTPLEIPQDTYQARLSASTQYNFRFRLRTQLRIMANVNMDVNIDCEPLKIGVKDFAIEVLTNQDLQMNMTCTEEQAELGLLNGNTYQIRNRNRYQYNEGFCIRIQTNATNQIQAKLMIEATNQNQVGTWAYYDEATEEWISVPTANENGYLVANVDHFSYWTILLPDYTVAIIIGVGVGAGALIAV
ncbi:MAG: hypothetical protein MUP85_17790, partial [Candidatus Lokiarchaeota archaeon]|nr:hypothetical protein [Candidatus Lokiarchaeota archaeon]